jgi:ubiquinone/menaquinone biosynthesis C-methylase UbiE
MGKKIAGGNELLNPEKILKEVGLGYGSKVGDLGCGRMGFFALQAGKLIGDNGQVYAVDIMKNVLASIESRAKLEGLNNIKPIWSNLEILGATKIPESTLDFALLINILFQSKKQKEIITEAVRLLKTGGKIVIIDWKTGNTPFGPVSQDRVPPDKVEEIALNLNLKKEKSFEAGPYHYGFIFIK